MSSEFSLYDMRDTHILSTNLIEPQVYINFCYLEK